MAVEVALIAICALVIAVFGTGVVRRIAVTRGIIDVPNQRSSHAVPTPRGGGIGIVVAATLGFIALGVLKVASAELAFALVGGGVAVAVVGFIDDRRGASVAVRLLVHVAAAAWATFWLGELPPVHIGHEVYNLGGWGYVFELLVIVWVLNLFNFMDGIDGLAVTEAVIVAWGGAGLGVLAGGSAAVPATAVVFGAACSGFAVWNWPPAKIFMGDVGSGYLGYVIAVLALAAAHESPVALLVWLILGAAFFVDATLTLLRRLARLQPIHSPHRSHAYQWLARRWGTHKRVTVIFMVVNLAWLLPCALLATLQPAHALEVWIIATVPLGILAWVSGAGREEVW